MLARLTKSFARLAVPTEIAQLCRCNSSWYVGQITRSAEAERRAAERAICQKNGFTQELTGCRIEGPRQKLKAADVREKSGARRVCHVNARTTEVLEQVAAHLAVERGEKMCRTHSAIAYEKERLPARQKGRICLALLPECGIHFQCITRHAARGRYSLDRLAILAEEDHAVVAPR